MSKNNWECHCGKEVKTKKDLIRHVRKNHPKEAYILWDIMRDLGDEFSNSGMKYLQEQLMKNNDAQQRLIDFQKKYNKLVFDFNQMTKFFQAVQLGMQNVSEAIENNKEKS